MNRKWKTVSVISVRSDGHEKVDSSMYSGSGGVLFGQLKFIELLLSKNGLENEEILGDSLKNLEEAIRDTQELV